MSIIIVGGGMTGATLALAISTLTQGRLPVHLVEATAPEHHGHPGFDARSIALAQGTCQQLARVGIWPALAKIATPIRDIHVSDRGHAAFVHLNAAHYGVEALGQVVELHQVGKRLFTLLNEAPGITLHCPAKVIDVARTVDSATVTLDTGETLTAPLLVAADGSHSSLAKACNIGWQREDYGQIAVIANVATSEPHHGRAFERFTQHGPLALLPMSDGRSSLVWCHPRDAKAEIDGWSEAQFLSELQKAFGWRLGTLKQAGTRFNYPLQLQKANSHISHRLALVGNAAQTLHPIAGQGFNLGLRDVMTLAETLASAVAHGTDIGSYRVLSEYQQRRQPDQQATIGVTDGLIHLFANRWLPLMVGRNLGLLAMEGITPLRDAFTRRTLGWVDR
ncbi:2-octaprenyl-6-methoxyphenyl hydroxylase [Hafnia psychrotolerans]|jgi:2-octaprenyl-6-methoxyphenol hydroxylase|uniref:2-octaprenyl-6-methoxyphenyl hydroxylase n=1 Tax=Hafnia psychrotolerans TaxID=1477018 RepID=A0ABQ1H7X0_9GAMM|nr:2-octaprenyl-6-methoxyphenyl hydroxylase [Hafnia psychrotolerans]GGA60780.1 2-octaprenyl-6-methoxyphenyl hydroxylase [Hafnia psychrotolerans]